LTIRESNPERRDCGRMSSIAIVKGQFLAACRTLGEDFLK
jgi:hypothetical protein